MRLKSDSNGSPLVSIIIPSYNSANYLPEVIKNISDQDYKNIEVIIVDDGSTDDTPQVCASLIKKYRESKIQVVKQKNKGLSGARNTGIRVAKGEYILLLDADDLLGDSQIRLEVEYLEKHETCSIVYCSFKYFGAEDIIERLPDPGLWCKSSDNSEIIGFLMRARFIVVHSALFRRSIIKDVGIFNEEMRSIEDLDFWTRCYFAGKIFHFIEGTRCEYRIRPNSLSRNGEYMATMYADFLERNLVNVKGDKKHTQLIKNQLTEAYLSIASRLVVSENYRKAQRYVIKACRAQFSFVAYVYWCMFTVLPHRLFSKLLKARFKTLS